MTRQTTVLLALLATLALSGCVPVRRLNVKAVTDQETPLRFGVLPTDDVAGLKQRFTPLAEYLGRGLGRAAVVVVSPEYESLGALVDQDKADLGWFSGVVYPRDSSKYHLAPIAQSVLGGDATYRGIIVVRADSPLRSVQELRGKRFAFVDRESGSGFVAPCRTLLRAGLSPLDDLGTVAFTTSHFVSAQGVIDGKYDAAALYEQAPQAFKDRLDPTKLRVLTRTEPVLKDIVACSARASVEFRNKLWSLLESLPKSPEGLAVLKVLERYNQIDGFRRM
jgi:phosphate/phosphite/phosphonate ABC transporter binding protein